MSLSLKNLLYFFLVVVLGVALGVIGAIFSGIFFFPWLTAMGFVTNFSSDLPFYIYSFFFLSGILINPLYTYTIGSLLGVFLGDRVFTVGVPITILIFYAVAIITALEKIPAMGNSDSAFVFVAFTPLFVTLLGVSWKVFWKNINS